MRKEYNLILVLLMIFFSSCGEKKYEDYNENEFYEVQGIITKVKPTSSPFDTPRVRDIEYLYIFENNDAYIGGEKNIDLYLNQGQPIAVLIHKKDSLINFFGYIGTINERTLNDGYNFIKEHSE